MSDIIVSQGQITNITGKVSYSHDSNGDTTTWTYQGAFNDMATQYDIFRFYKWNADLQQDDAGVWNLTVNFPFDARNGADPSSEVPSINWDLIYETENKSILDVDNATVNLVTSISAKAISDAIKEGKEEIVTNRLNLLASTGKITQDNKNASLVLYHHMKAGVKTIPIDVPILQKSAVTSNNWQINWSQANRGRIYSTNSLISSEQIDQRLLSTLQQFQDVYTPNGSADKFIPKAYGWKKGSPKTSLGSNNRNQVSQQWTYGLWPTVFFGTPL